VIKWRKKDGRRGEEGERIEGFEEEVEWRLGLVYEAEFFELFE
jgi:hypothetical protein